MTYPPPYGWNPDDPQLGGYPHPNGYPLPAPYPVAGGYPPARTETNGMAIGALVCSIAGLATCALSSVVGVVLGIIALNQIKRTGQQGRGMALAGVVIGGVVTALVVIGLIVYVIFFVWLVNEGSFDYSTY